MATPATEIHTATVVRVSGHEVEVSVQVQEACAACRAKGACGVPQGDVRHFTVFTPTLEAYAVGDQVGITIEHTMGVKAVLLAYVLPFGVVMALLLTLISCGVGELISGIAALAAVVIYYVVLSLFRDRLSREITLQLLALPQQKIDEINQD